MGKRKMTRDIFGGYLDRYTLADSEADGSTVPIFYEGRTTDAAVKGASRMDAVFFQWFSGLTDEQRQTLQRQVRYNSTGARSSGADRGEGQRHSPPLHQHRDCPTVSRA